MKDKKVLYVSSEVLPYSPYSELAKMSFETPRMVNTNGGQIRIFMPKFGNINERRHQLHEVIRLSGMNIVINDIDVPLIIKVASIPKERIQVYFIDNDEYFARTGTLFDEENNMYPDNDERCIFFAKGIVETVKNSIGYPILSIYTVGFLLCCLFTCVLTIKMNLSFPKAKLLPLCLIVITKVLSMPHLSTK